MTAPEGSVRYQKTSVASLRQGGRHPSEQVAAFNRINRPDSFGSGGRIQRNRQLGFIQSDFDRLGKEQKGLYVSRLRQFILGWSNLADSLFDKSFFDQYLISLLTGRPNPAATKAAEIQGSIKKIQKALLDFLYQVLTRGEEAMPLPPISVSFIQSVLETPDTGTALDLSSSTPAQFKFGLRFTLKKNDLTKRAVLNLALLLQGLPSTSITKCLEERCQKIFFHPSLKEKLYCSTKCAWRHLSQKRRDELKRDPERYEEYLKRQRDLMRKKYDDRIHEEHPKAKITRRVK